MRQFTKEIGYKISARVTVSKFGKTAVSTSATGEATSLAAKVGSSCQTEATMRDSGKNPELKVKESTTTCRLG